MIDSHAPMSAWLTWLLSEAAPAMLAGLAIISVVMAVIGYILSALFWRWWISRKWRAPVEIDLRLVDKDWRQRP